MKTILITGAHGFLGRNLAAHLKPRDDVLFYQYGRGNSQAELRAWAAEADVIYHLAGVNRPQDPAEYETGNAGFTTTLCNLLRDSGRTPHIIASSSTQATCDNPYGVSKRHAEEVLEQFAVETGARLSVFRLTNVFGKWSRPNYNSVVATFCHNIAHDLPIQVNDPQRELELVYVDDVVAAFGNEMEDSPRCAEIFVPHEAIPSYALTLGDLADRIQRYRDMQQSLAIPDFSDRFNQQLYATYLSFVEPERWEYGLEKRSDPRGSLAEFVKSAAFGQIFVSRTGPGITRGNHYHHTKTEKFLVLSGEALIRFRDVEGDTIHEFPIRGEDYRVVDIPPGYTHSITNVGTTEMITLFWASEIFNPAQADTYFVPVDPPPNTED